MSDIEICLWKGVIERDILRYGRQGRGEETLMCGRCDGYNEECPAYLEASKYQAGLRYPNPRDL